MQTWCIPPKADADFVYHMEDVLQTSQRPYDPQFPVVCMDEASKQLIAEIAVPLPTKPGYTKRVDYAYERKGVCTQFVLCEPLRGWRHVHVTQRRTQRDWAQCIRALVDVYCPAPGFTWCWITSTPTRAPPCMPRFRPQKPDGCWTTWSSITHPNTRVG